MSLRGSIARHWPILAAAASTGLVVAAAWALSYSALMALGRSAGEVGAFLGLQLDAIYPVTVDGTLGVAIVGALVLRRAPLQTRAYAWALIGAATAVSIAGNAAHSLAHGGDLVLPPLAAAAASAVPACSLAASLHLLILVARAHRDVAPLPIVVSAPAAAIGADVLPAIGAPASASPNGHAGTTGEGVTLGPAATTKRAERAGDQARSARTRSARSAAVRASRRAPNGARHDEVRALLEAPGGRALTGAELGELLGVDPGYARRLRSEVEREDGPGRRPRVLDGAAAPAAAAELEA